MEKLRNANNILLLNNKFAAYKVWTHTSSQFVLWGIIMPILETGKGLTLAYTNSTSEQRCTLLTPGPGCAGRTAGKVGELSPKYITEFASKMRTLNVLRFQKHTHT